MKALNTVNTDRLRHNLHTVVDDVEQVLKRMSDATGEQVDGLASNASNHLHDARDRLLEAERHTAAQIRRATRNAQGYVRDHPWQVVGGLAVIGVAAAVLAKTRH